MSQAICLLAAVLVTSSSSRELSRPKPALAHELELDSSRTRTHVPPEYFDGAQWELNQTFPPEQFRDMLKEFRMENERKNRLKRD